LGAGFSGRAVGIGRGSGAGRGATGGRVGFGEAARRGPTPGGLFAALFFVAGPGDAARARVAGPFLGGVRPGAERFTAVLRAGAFLAGDLFAAARLGGDRFAGVFPDGDFLAGALFAGALFAGTFFTGDFFAGAFLEDGFFCAPLRFAAPLGRLARTGAFLLAFDGVFARFRVLCATPAPPDLSAARRTPAGGGRT
jgi:hypothetical protein